MSSETKHSCLRQLRAVLTISTAAAVALALAACGDDPTPPTTRRAGSLDVVGGLNQEAEVGSALGAALEVLVRDSAGQPLAGALVSFTARNGSIASGSVRTNASGRASGGRWSLGERSGLDTIVVTVAGVAPRIITARARAGAPVSLGLSNPTGFQARVFENMDLPVFRVLDRFGNGVPGIRMTFRALNLDGTMPTSRVAPLDDVTDAFGIVGLTTWMPYVVGEHRLQASVLDGVFTSLATRRVREDACGARRVIGFGMTASFQLDDASRVPGCADTLHVVTVVTTTAARLQVQAGPRAGTPSDPTNARSVWLTRAPAWATNPQVIVPPSAPVTLNTIIANVQPGNYDIRVGMPRGVASLGTSLTVTVGPVTQPALARSGVRMP